MRFFSAIGYASLLSITACSGKTAAKIDENVADVAASRWNGRLATPSAMSGAVQVRGNTWMSRDGNRIRAHVAIENATRGGVHPWHVHRGRCGYDNGIVGSPTAYPLLKVGDDGDASANATLDVSFPTDGEYFVNVHASPDNLQTVLACGNLAPPTHH